MKKLSFILLLLIAFNSKAVDRFVSSTGDDLANGLSEATAWQTISKVNSFTFSAGDRILFRRGDTFTGGLRVRGNGVTVDAYGTGDKPIFTGLSNITSWTNKGSNIWESTSSVSTLPYTNLVVINGQNKAMGRYPNSTWFYYQSHVGKGQITSTDLTGTPNWTGAEIAIFATTYGLNRGPVTSQSGNTLTFGNTASQEEIQEQALPLRFFFQNDIRTLDIQDEWYYNPGTKKLSIYSTSMPSNVQISVVDTLLDIYQGGYGDISNVTVRNISLIGANSIGLIMRRGQNIKISNVDFNFSGLNAIYAPYWGDSYNLVIDSCTFDNSQNTAIGLNNDWRRATYSNNIIKNTGTIPGMGAPAGDYGYGGYYTAINGTGNGSKNLNNKITNTAYVAIRFLGDSSVVINNYVDSACTFIHDGGGIYTWNGDGNHTTQHGIKVLNNIVRNVTANCGIYIDDHSNNIDVIGNTVENCNYGIYLHNTWNVNVRENTVFASLYCGMLIDNNDLSTPMYGNILKKNLFIGKEPLQRAAFYPMEKVRDGFVSMDSNTYAVPIDDNKTIDGVLGGAYGRKTLEQWKAISGKEVHSKKSPKTITDSDDFRLEYNETSSTKSIDLGLFSWVDMDNVTYSGTTTLAPFKSILLIKDGSYTPPIAPTANAGADKTITLPTSSVALLGSSTSASGHTSTYLWTKVSGSGSQTISGSTTLSPTISGLTIAGSYIFNLTVTQDDSQTATDNVTVTVNSAAIAPTVTNSGNQTILTNNTSVSSSAIPASGQTITNYLWIKLSGTGSIVSPTSQNTGITGLSGTSVFRIIVTQTDSQTGYADLTINVITTPTVNAGIDQVITLPTNNVNLSGSATAGSGAIVSYVWTKLSGGAATIVSPTSINTTVTGLVAGTYIFRLTVTDSNSLTASDNVQVIVNIPPTSNAGLDQIIRLPFLNIYKNIN